MGEPDSRHPDAADGPVPTTSEPLPVQVVVTVDNLGAARDVIRSIAMRAGIAVGEIEDLVAAAAEIMNNAICHGGGRGWLTVDRVDDTVVVEVRDRGPGFSNPPPTTLPSPLATGGRGLLIAQLLCPSIEIVDASDGVTVLMTVKSRDRAAAPQQAGWPCGFGTRSTC